MENLSEQKMMPKKKNCLNFLKHYGNVLNKITTLKKENTIYSKFFKENKKKLKKGCQESKKLSILMKKLPIFTQFA